MPDDTKPSLKPPKEWFDKKYQEVKTGNPTYTEEQVNATVGKIWYKEMSESQKRKRRKDEGKKCGHAEKSISFDHFCERRAVALKSYFHRNFDLEQQQIDEMTADSLDYTYYGERDDGQRSQPLFKGVTGIVKPVYRGKRPDDVKYNPAIIVNCYDKKGAFERMEVHTAPEVLKSPEKYDEDTFWYLIANLSAERWNHAKDRVELLSKCIQELKTREEEREKELKKIGESPELKEAQPSNWELEQRYFFGKSFVFVTDVNV